MKITTKSYLRITLSVSALILFVVCALCDNLIIPETMSYNSYGWRSSVLTDLALLLPYIALFTFALLERYTTHINKRLYLFLIFAIVAVQYFVAELLLSTRYFLNFYRFFEDVLGSYSIMASICLVIQVVMMVLLPIARNTLIKLYSVFYLVLCFWALGYSVADWVITDVQNLAECVMLVSAILFYLALYQFNEMLTDENASCLYKAIATFVLSPFFGNVIERNGDEDELDFDFDDFTEEVDLERKEALQKRVNHHTEYQKLLAYAVYHEENSVLEASLLIEELSKQKLLDDSDEPYSAQYILSQFEHILQYGREINQNHGDYIDEETLQCIGNLIDEKDDPMFRVDSVLVAGMLCGCFDHEWYDAVCRLEEVVKQADQSAVPENRVVTDT